MIRYTFICIIFGLGAALTVSGGLRAQAGEHGDSGRMAVARLPDIDSWGYQLQNIKPREIAAAGHDLVVIDYSRDGSGRGAFTRDEVARMQKKPDGGRRLVIAYLSIGEAESYRNYWQPTWKQNPPRWLKGENPEWPGNYPVRYWNREWQKIIFAYLGAIMDAGFDGVYLDRIDVFENFAARSSAKSEMIDFVRAIARRAVGLNKKFYIIAQNAESLLQRAPYRAAISGIAKEDLLFGVLGDGRPNTRNEISWSLKYLAYARKQRLPVLVVEYLDDEEIIAKTARKLRKLGFVATFSSRELDRLSAEGAPLN